MPETIPFVKYHGTGNDFIIIDNREGTINPGTRVIREMCDRHFGIGADGLMMLETAPGFDFGMRYFNSDGLESSMCGNGGRCMCAFAHELGITGSSPVFTAIDGLHFANIIKSPLKGYIVKLRMKDVPEVEDTGMVFRLDTGSPHYVKFVTNVETMDVFNSGRKIRYDESPDPKGVNVDFAEIRSNELFVRSYERGVEDETLSCGTGVTASAIAFALSNQINENYIKVETRGGSLKVYFKREGRVFRDVWLEGPAIFVYKGEFETSWTGAGS